MLRGPQTREAARMEEMRRKKREQLDYVRALETTYGREGAIAMMKAEEESERSSRARGRFTKSDRDAIEELDRFDAAREHGDITREEP